MDKAEHVNNKVLNGQDNYLGRLNVANLSTGTKTLINILKHPEVCFDIFDWGMNGRQFIKDISEKEVH
ncbi:MAG: DUF4869 domain-containing protein [Lachnospiraceae bacterium]|nr:DUF4869 domain-containing protein [Lachnospiraceae bacterium]